MSGGGGGGGFGGSGQRPTFLIEIKFFITVGFVNAYSIIANLKSMASFSASAFVN